MQEYNHIELFAGCGGMSVGLEAAGFKLYMANEISPMAGETFAYNILNEDLSKLSETTSKAQKSLWIKSKYANDDLSQRLRENPRQYENGKYSDLTKDTDFNNKLIIGNIDHFLTFLTNNRAICRNLQDQNIDLLSGGPPCQGFSMAGKRIKDDSKNLLPLSFAKFADLVQPKVVLLENVKGITSPFRVEDGTYHYAWLEVAKAFALKGFVPVCMLLNSKYFGVPQNRPRFILYAFRKDIFDQLSTRISNSEITNGIISNSISFFNKVKNRRSNLSEIKVRDLKLYDIESDSRYFDGSLLPIIITQKSNFISSSRAIGDIKNASKKYILSELNADYPSSLNKLFKPNFSAANELFNHETRKHTYKVQARFRVYQILNNLNGLRQDALNAISGKDIDSDTWEKVYNSFKNDLLLMNDNGKVYLDKANNLKTFKEYLEFISSKKHSQRAIKKDDPAPAQLTIPDDLCHYSKSQLRTFTVREMARFQSFPDWFVFRSKSTTGGQQRSFEVPQYTQVGNAVPPLLAYELGKTIMRLLNSIEHDNKESKRG